MLFVGSALADTQLEVHRGGQERRPGRRGRRVGCLRCGVVAQAKVVVVVEELELVGVGVVEELMGYRCRVDEVR